MDDDKYSQEFAEFIFLTKQIFCTNQQQSGIAHFSLVGTTKYLNQILTRLAMNLTYNFIMSLWMTVKNKHIVIIIVCNNMVYIENNLQLHCCSGYTSIYSTILKHICGPKTYFWTQHSHSLKFTVLYNVLYTVQCTVRPQNMSLLLQPLAVSMVKSKGGLSKRQSVEALLWSCFWLGLQLITQIFLVTVK